MKLLVLGLIGSALAGGSPATPVEVGTTVQPATAGVGDPVEYVVRARLDAEDVDVSSVRIFADTGPFAQIAPARTTRTRGALTNLVTMV